MRKIDKCIKSLKSLALSSLQGIRQKNRSLQNSNKMTLPNYNKVLKKRKVYSMLTTLITYNKTSLKNWEYCLLTPIILPYPTKAMCLFVNTKIITHLQICNEVLIHLLILAHT